MFLKLVKDSSLREGRKQSQRKEIGKEDDTLSEFRCLKEDSERRADEETGPAKKWNFRRFRQLVATDMRRLSDMRREGVCEVSEMSEREEREG